ncbi:MAG: hypothetical protein COB16_16080 [Rhodobacteraceae bacterium]|nr:MAG: hypothetical protein COB16_16080 [Paracoccaceae bacterium]
MEASQSLLELVAAAQANAKTSEDRISEILKLMNGQTASDAQVEDLRAATVSLELAAVDIFSLFEARMQHHFRRGPFSRKLKSLLLEAKQTDLADRVHHYYLAINVLKHGKGASYRELLKTPSPLVVLKPTEDIIADEAHAPAGLVDVAVPGFFDGLTMTIIEAYHFLENRQVS